MHPDRKTKKERPMASSQQQPLIYFHSLELSAWTNIYICYELILTDSSGLSCFSLKPRQPGQAVECDSFKI